LVRHKALDWMRATLDGMVEDEGAVFEAKFMLPWNFAEDVAGPLPCAIPYRRSRRSAHERHGQVLSRFRVGHTRPVSAGA
jgi:hypothetical protein